MSDFTSTFNRATLMILIARSPKFKLHLVSLTSLNDGAMHTFKNKCADYVQHCKSVIANKIICTYDKVSFSIVPKAVLQ